MKPRLWRTRRDPLLLASLLALATAAGGCFRDGEGVNPIIASNTSQAAEAMDRAERLRAQGLDDVALAELERVIAENPELTDAYLEVGDIHETRGDYAKAEEAYGRAAQVEPRNFNAQYKHGLMLQLLNRLAEAVQAYLRALQIQPDDFDANLNLATAYLQLGEPEQALVYARRAVTIDPRSAPARINLGAVYASLEEHQQAVIEYQQAAELMQLTPELLLNLADSLGKARRYAEMQSTLEQLIQVQPSAAAYERLGSALFRMQRYDQSLEAYRQALALDPDYYPALNGVGVNLLNRYLWNNKQDAAAREEGIRALRRSLQIEPRQPEVLKLVTRYG